MKRRKATCTILAVCLLLLGTGTLAVPEAGDGASAEALTASSKGVVPPFEIPWSSLDAGVLISAAGGGYEMSGTLGQADTGPAATGGVYQVTGGFWVVDQGSTGLIFSDGFEGGDVSNWSSAIGN